jgi:alpha-1,3-mannosyltransferase
MAAAPFARGEVSFRWSRPGECYQGEPQLLCKDLWWSGHGRIAVVPGVHLAYTDSGGRWVKKERGYVSDFVRRVMDAGLERIDWEERPPEMVKCVPTFTEQWWLPWNESLA